MGLKNGAQKWGLKTVTKTAGLARAKAIHPCWPRKGTKSRVGLEKIKPPINTWLDTQPHKVRIKKSSGLPPPQPGSGLVKTAKKNRQSGRPIAKHMA